MARHYNTYIAIVVAVINDACNQDKTDEAQSTIKKLLIISLLITANCLQLFSQVNDIHFQRLSSQDGLSNGSVTSIFQDSQGYMWFGTWDGLNKYNGNTFTIYRKNPEDSTSISENIVDHIMEDHKKNLWICTWGGGLNMYDRTTDRFISYQHSDTNSNSISSNKVRLILEDHNQFLWIGTDKGLNRFNPETKEFIHYKHNKNKPVSLSGNYVTAIIKNNKNNLWVGTYDNGLNLFNEKSQSFTHYKHNPDDRNSLISNNIWTIFEDSKGILWIGTNKGVSYFDPASVKPKFKHFIHDDSNPLGLTKGTATVIFEDTKKNIWIGTSYGLNLYNKESDSFTHFLHESGNNTSIAYSNVWSIFEDKAGNLWFGSRWGGISFYIPEYNKFSCFKHDPTNPNSLSNKSILAFCEEDNGNIRIGVDQGGLQSFNPNSHILTHDKFNSGKQISDDVAILSLYKDKKGYLWMGTWGKGLLKYNTATAELVQFLPEQNNPGSISGSSISCIFEDSKNNIWIGTVFKGVNLYDREKNTFIHYLSDRDDPKFNIPKEINQIFEDSNNDLWFCTASGLRLFNRDNNSFTVYAHDTKNRQSLSSNHVRSIHEDRKGVLWIGTNYGLNRFDRESETFKSYHKKDGLPNEVIVGILEDEHGNLWLSTYKGVSKFNTQNGNFKNYDITDGLPGDQFNFGAYLKIKNGKLLLGSTDGFTIFHPDSIKDNEYIPPIFITDFKLFNKSVRIGDANGILQKHISQTKEIILSYQQSVFEFTYAALNYASPEKNQYAYMLEGFEDEWQYVGNKRIAAYTNLDPGEYTFRVKGSNNSGLWNEKGTSIKLIITPPFWRTWWFYSLIIIFILLCIFTYIGLRTRKLIADKKVLEAKLKEHTAEVIMQKEKIEEKNDELSQQNEEIQAINNSLNEQKKVIEERNVELSEQGEELKLQNEEITIQRDKINSQHKAITDSIEYAKRIQTAVLPRSAYIDEILPDNFILNMPRNVVSGDFYVVRQVDHYIIIAVADCTGHGVPGAIMSMLGISFLNEIVRNKEITQANQVLNKLRKQIKRSLHQTGRKGETEDGMDVALCAIDTRTNILQYSGANNPVYIVQNGEFKEIKPDRMPIGFYVNETASFTNHEIQLNDGDIFYLFSDGFMDQFGGKNGFKYKASNFQQILFENHGRPMVIQMELLEQELKNWMKGYEQTDDILVMGVRV